KRESMAMVPATSPAGVLSALEHEDFDAALIDLNYARDTTSGGEGLDLLSRLRTLDPTLPIVVITAWGSVEGAVEAMRRGAREHGTGKEVVARYIHSASKRAGRPLVTVNAGGVAEGVFESELFGHLRGAFTDAKTDRAGAFEVADGGTLFLDEVGNMPMQQQAKL